MTKIQQIPEDEAASRKRRWRRWGWWLFIGINLAGLVVLWPILKITWPLVSVWWHTRSADSYRAYEARQSAGSNSPAARVDTPNTDATTAAALADLTNQLARVANLAEGDLAKIVAAQYGARPTNAPKESIRFDTESAVFHRINKTIETFNGQTFHCYEVDLVDAHGSHKFQYECFTEPNLEYERSRATMDLIAKNPQLQKVYGAIAHVLAERSASGSASSPDAPDSTNQVASPDFEQPDPPPLPE